MRLEKQSAAAIDLGASNGRVMLGRLQDRRLTITEIHRFNHHAAMRDGHLRWNWKLIHAEIRRGLLKSPIPCAVSCCSWAQDFGLLDEHGRLLEDPIAYLDRRTDGMPAAFRHLISPEALVERAGVGTVAITTLCQLRACAMQNPEMLARAHLFLPIANLVLYDLCGVAAMDWTLASAGQLCNRQTNTLDKELLQLLEIPTQIFPPLHTAPTMLGHIPPTRAPSADWVGMPAILAAGHDTPSAFYVLPEDETDTLFISCGTWLMLGTRYPQNMPAPQNNAAILLGLADGSWGAWRGRLGLWLIQQCQQKWQQQGITLTPAELAEAAGQSHNQTLLDLDNPRLVETTNVPQTIQQLCLETAQSPPQTPGDTARIIFRSLAAAVRRDLKILQDLTHKTFQRIRIVGGGSQNAAFCQWLADACELPVVAGPVEASATGNFLLQFKALEAVKNKTELDEVRRLSCALRNYCPLVIFERTP